ncbi:YihY/virulence factor BrkB family protein [Dechloromonas sp. H13]|uniref:YihY/virulence factor BrkB family protein n=1 Tax=Dechloromonas sp. H13 TaxID=2570193 RepID=UPI0012908D32|nr:YihY/virulence factor BrkB family protein [Dechloromonas sp. H13]
MRPFPVVAYMDDVLRFVRRVLATFMQNQGLLLAGAIAYYMLLSILPLLILLVLALSPFLPAEQLLSTLSRYLDLMAPGLADPLVDQLARFLGHREVTGGVLLATLLFSSSLAFTVLEKSLATIFHHRVKKHRRHWITSALIPYAYILVIGAGLLLVTLASMSLEALGTREVVVFGHIRSLEGTAGALLYAMGLSGEILLLSSIYMVMPSGRLSWRHALVGGVTAGLLWELTRHLLAWFFATLSKIGVLYGSFATAISLLLSFEIAATVLLIGAQVIALYEQRPRRRPAASGEG